MKLLTVVFSLFLSSCTINIENIREDKCTTKCTKKYWNCMDDYGNPLMRDCYAEKYICLDLCRGSSVK